MTVFDIKDLLPDVLTFAPYCNNLMAVRAIREAARELCALVPVWRDNDCFQITAPQYEGVCTLQDSAIVRIERARLDDTILAPRTVQWLDNHYPDWLAESGQPRFVTQLAPDTVTVTPKTGGMLHLRLVLAPSLTARTLPRVLVSNYRTEITRGAAGRILTSPHSDAANPSLGVALVAEFKERLDTLTHQALKTQLNAPLRTRPNYF